MISFHPVADLFPLIKGAEFDDLVASIKANGLRESITMFNGSILDGRNRYRACEAASVEARFETYTGDDPVAYVVDKNIHRRQLTASQRAMIAAEMAKLSRGGDRRSEIFKVSMLTLKPVSVKAAATLMGVNKISVVAARRVIAEGTEEEIEAVKQGNAAVTTIAKQLRDKVPKETRTKYLGKGKGRSGKNPERIETMRANAKIWGSLRDGLTAFANLPMPADVVPIALQFNRVGFLESRLDKTIKYLMEFQNGWNQRGKAAPADEQNTDDNYNTGTGN